MRLARSIAHPFTLIALSMAVSAALWPGRGYLKATRAGGSPSRKTAASAPFRAGERLFYQVGWMNLTEAATAELRVEPPRDFYGVPVWHFQATAQTEDPLRLLMAVSDQFDSYCDASTLVTRQYELYLNEEDKRTVRKLALDDGSPGAARVGAPKGTRDPLAMLYRLRLVNWQRTPQFLSTVYDGTHFYRVVARLAAVRDSVTVPAGQFDASRIDIEVSPEEPGARPMQLTLWLANNSARTPVELDAQVTLGVFKGELVRME